MIRVTSFEKQQLALELILRDARLTLIHDVTDIPIKVLRPTYKAIHGRSSRSGQPKQSSRGLTRKRQAYQEVTLFAVYLQMTNTQSNQDTATKVIDAFDRYKAQFPANRLDFYGMWLIANELVMGIIKLTECDCGAAVLLNAKDDLDDRCLVCGKRY